MAGVPQEGDEKIVRGKSKMGKLQILMKFVSIKLTEIYMFV